MPYKKGHTPWNKGKTGVYSQETRHRLGSGRRGRTFGPLSEEHKQKIGDVFRGKVLGEEHKRKISDANRGRRHTEQAKRRMSQALRGRQSPMQGKQHTEETKRKISRSKKGQGPWNKGRVGVYSQDTLRQWGEQRRGRLLTREHKHKLAVAGRAAWASGAFDGRKPKSLAVTHQGTQMRSTWEVRLAQALDKLNWPWEYEAHRFEYALADGMHTYTPDFYVPRLDCYFDPHEAHWTHNDGKFDAVREQCDIALIVLSESLLEMYERLAG